VNEEPSGGFDAVGNRISENGREPVSVRTGGNLQDRGAERTASVGSSDNSYADTAPSSDGAASPVDPPAAEETPRTSKRKEFAGSIREIVETLALALIFFFALRAVVQNFRVEGSSMYPNFADGQYVLVNKGVYTHADSGSLPGWVPFLGGSAGSARYLFHPPRRGDVIVFHPPPPNDPSRDFIKRVIATPGDTVDVRQGKVFVNGGEVVEPYIHQPTLPINARYTHVVLGADQFFVLGDNRGNSSDSRAWGPVSSDEIVGRTWLVYWPVSAWRVAPNHSENVPAPAAP
jgi:signal peptidase I